MRGVFEERNRSEFLTDLFFVTLKYRADEVSVQAVKEEPVISDRFRAFRPCRDEPEVERRCEDAEEVVGFRSRVLRVE